MSWSWVAMLDLSVDADALAVHTAVASAVAHDEEGRHVGVLAAWPKGGKPVRRAVRMDARLADPAGAAGWVSLGLIDAERAPLFDDPAVSGALRRVLAGPPADAVTTFVRDSSQFVGAMTVRRTDGWLLRDDPFARLAPALVLRVDPGMLAAVPPSPGPVTQRYSGLPWPAAGF